MLGFVCVKILQILQQLFCYTQLQFIFTLFFPLMCALINSLNFQIFQKNNTSFPAHIFGFFLRNFPAFCVNIISFRHRNYIFNLILFVMNFLLLFYYLLRIFTTLFFSFYNFLLDFFFLLNIFTVQIFITHSTNN